MRRLTTTTRSFSTLRLHDVTPRDGLQNEKTILSLADKQQLVRNLIQICPNGIELTSFVRADRVPALARGSELCTRLEEDEDFIRFKKNGGYAAALVPNMKGMESFLKHRSVLDTVVVLVSCTDSHSKANVNMTMKEAMKATMQIISLAKSEQVNVRAYASLAFGCPFEKIVPSERVVDLVTEYYEIGADSIVLADTLGVGVPEQVKEFAQTLMEKRKIPSNKLGLHLHDSHNRAHENVIEGWKQGIRDFDASVGGCGGCNFAPGSKGNISIEKLLRALNSLPTGKHNLDVKALNKANTHLSAALNRNLEI